MPEVTEDDVQLGERPLSPLHPAETKQPDHSLLETIGAAASTDNTFTSTLTAFQSGAMFDANVSGYVNPSYDPFERAKTKGVSPEYWDKFVYVNDDKEFDRVQKRIDTELQNRRIVAESGNYGIAASLMSAVGDPINVIPFGKAIEIGRGAGVARNVIETAKAGAASTIASEAVLQSTQLTRTPEESAVNIGGGVLLAGLLGAGTEAVAKALGKGGTSELSASLEKGLSDTVAIPDTPMEQATMTNRADSVGAARTPETTLAQESFVSNPAFASIEKTFGQLSPMVRTMDSPLKSVRDITQRLVEVPLQLQKNLEGIATPQAVATNIKRHQAYLAEAVSGGRDEFKAYKKSLSGKTDTPSMNEAQFMDEIGKAMRREDKHANPFVQKAAQKYRNALYNVEKEEAVKLDLLPHDIAPDTAPSYLNRVWNVNKIIQEEPRFRSIVNAWATKAYNDAVTAAKIAVRDGKEGSVKADQAEIDLKTRLNPSEENDYINEITTNTLNAIKGYDQETGFLNIKPTTRGPLKDRTFNIPDAMAEDYLESNVEKLGKRFSRIISAEIELKREFGTTKFEDVRKEITQDHNDTIQGITDPAQLKKLDKQYRADVRDLSGMWDLVRGTYRASTSKPDDIVRRGLKFARTYKYITSLGGVVVASLSDVAMPVFVHGIDRVFGDAVVPLMKQLSSPEFKNFASMSKATARRAGLAVEAELNARASSIYAIGDPYANGTVMERMMDGLGRGFGRVSGLNWWNDSMKNVSAMVSQARILDGVTSSSISKKDDVWMNEIGLDKDMRGRIAEQFAKHGEDVEGHRIANDDQWDKPVAQALYNALLKDVDRTIITKGTGDVPLFAETELGKTFLQFQSFSMAANQRVLMSGLQRMDAQVMQGFAGLVGLGMLTYVLKRKEQGKDLSDNPLVWMQEGVDRSGIIAMPMWMNNRILEPSGFGVSNITGARPSRMSTQNAFIDLAGPTAGLVTDAFKTSRMISDLVAEGKATQGDITASRRMIPYQNLTGVRWLFDAAEDGLKNTIGTKKNR